jgi:hypothetical protein
MSTITADSNVSNDSSNDEHENNSPMTMWQDAPSGGDNKLTFQYAVNSSSRKELELFLQEIIQNPKDAGLQHTQEVNDETGDESPHISCPHVNFRINILEGDEKKSFLDHFEWVEQKPHIEAVNQKNNGLSYKTYEKLMNQTSLCTLYVEDYNTVGLIGPEDTDEQSSETKCFAGVFSRGTSEKAGPSSGGTNGYGKAVMHIFSGVKTFAAFSKLSKPYQSKRYKTDGEELIACDTDSVDQALDPNNNEQGQSTEVSYRLMAETAYPQHSKPEKRSSKIGFVHYSMPRPNDSDVPLPFVNETAKYLADKIHFNSRGAEDTGTSFLILDFLDKDADGDQCIDSEDKARSILDRIEEACRKLYWPAIVDQKITVSTQWGSEEPKQIELDISDWDLHKKLYKDYKAGRIQSVEDVDQELNHSTACWVEKRQFTVPKRTTHLHKVFEKTPYNNPLNESKEANAVAVMGYTKSKEKAQLVTFRGSRQIIEFIDLKNEARSDGFYPYGIVLLGDVASQDDLGENVAQSFLEQLIAISEPIAHDKLDPKSENMRNANWHSAPARIREINNWIKSLGVVQDDDSSTGSDAAPDLAQLFSFLKGAGSDAKKTVLGLGTKKIDIDQNGKCTFSFTVKVPGKKNKSKFTQWSVEPKVSLASKTRNVDLSVKLNKVTTTTDPQTDLLANNLLVNDQTKYSGDRPTTENTRTYCFEGEVVPLVDVTAKVELHILTKIKG